MDNGSAHKPRSPEARSIANLGVCSVTFGSVCSEISRELDSLEGDARTMLVLRLRKELREQIDTLCDTDRALAALTNE
jgi:hypothetical protein